VGNALKENKRSSGSQVRSVQEPFVEERSTPKPSLGVSPFPFTAQRPQTKEKKTAHPIPTGLGSKRVYQQEQGQPTPEGKGPWWIGRGGREGKDGKEGRKEGREGCRGSSVAALALTLGFDEALVWGKERQVTARACDVAGARPNKRKKT
jgi:hypothetical protein